MEIINIAFILLAPRSVGGMVVNLAFHKPATMSSFYPSWIPENAVDKNHGTDSDSCALSKEEDLAPFWIVDLQGTFPILSVMLTNRHCYWQQLFNFAIEIFTKNPLRSAAAVPVLCTNYTGATLASLESRNFTCSHPITGRFVRIKKWKTTGSDPLALCDVQVFAEDTDCRPWVTLNQTQGRRMTSQKVGKMNNCSSVECAGYCQGNEGCVAFNYNRVLQICELVLDPRFEDELESNSDWSYYGSDV